MTPLNYELQRFALMLRNSNPEAWDGFLRVFSAYTYEVTVAVTEASPNEVMEKQGRSRQLRALERIFKECDASSRKSTPQ